MKESRNTAYICRSTQTCHIATSHKKKIYIFRMNEKLQARWKISQKINGGAYSTLQYQPLLYFPSTTRSTIFWCRTSINQSRHAKTPSKAKWRNYHLWKPVSQIAIKSKKNHKPSIETWPTSSNMINNNILVPQNWFIGSLNQKKKLLLVCKNCQFNISHQVKTKP